MIALRQTAEFAAWFAALRDHRAQVAIAKRMVRLQSGLFGDCQPVGEGVSEARIFYGPGYRVYFVQRGAELIILLCGGDKKSQSRDIAKALKLARET